MTTTTTTRDSQRAKLYQAERAVKDRGKMFVTVADMQRYVDNFMDRAYIRRNYWEVDWRRITVTDGRGRRSAIAYAAIGEIAMPKWSRCELFLLHELAHIYAGGAAKHGWQFAQVYLDFVRHMMGEEIHNELRAAMRVRGVRYTQPRKRKPLTPEARARAQANLVKAREARQTAAAAKDPDDGPESLKALLRF